VTPGASLWAREKFCSLALVSLVLSISVMMALDLSVLGIGVLVGVGLPTRLIGKGIDN
jgi:hypothetical protein